MVKVIFLVFLDSLLVAISCFAIQKISLKTGALSSGICSFWSTKMVLVEYGYIKYSAWSLDVFRFGNTYIGMFRFMSRL